VAILKNLFKGDPGTETVAGDAKPLPSASSTGPKATAADSPGAPSSARSSVPIFGGHRGGRKRKDGLKPGSQAAHEADKERDAERKRLERAEAADLRDPPPLPAGPGPMAPQAISVAGMPGADAFAPDIVVKWHAKDVEKLVAQFIALTEELCTKSVTTRCQKANLPEEVASKITNDVAWAQSAKDMIEEGGSELAAKYLNESQISPEIKPFILIAIGTLQIAINHQQVLKRLDAIISQQRQPKE
jgi:hypothetical protein